MFGYIIISDYGETIEGYCFLTYTSALNKVSKLANEKGSDKGVEDYTILKVKIKI